MNTLHTFASKYIIDNNIKAAILLRESDKYKMKLIISKVSMEIK